MSKISSSYLLTSISGSFPTKSENRLSKVFCASFNNSDTFQKLFLKFIGIKERSKLIAIDQNYRKTKRRNFLDIVIYTRDRYGMPNKLKLVIENKINAALTGKQLIDYNKVKGIRNIPKSRKIALVKNYFELKDYSWRIKHWTELYLFFTKFCKTSNSSIDTFIINNFLKYLEENNMSTVNSISREDLNSIIEIFSVTEKLKSGNVFKTLKWQQSFDIATKFIKMMEEVVIRAKESPVILKKSKKFQFNPRISSIEPDEEKLPFLWSYIQLKKNKRYKSLCTGITFKDNKSMIITFVKDLNDEYDKELIFKGKVLDLDKYSKLTITYWEKKLKKI